MSNSKISNTPYASLARQLAAAFYDGLLLIAITLVAIALTVPLTKSGVLPPGSPIISIYLFLIIFFSITWFWTHTGQTLGMRVWHVRVQQPDGQLINWKQATARFLVGVPAWSILCLALFTAYVKIDLLPDWLSQFSARTLFIIGCIWLVLDHWENSWRDKLIGTQTIVVKTK